MRSRYNKRIVVCLDGTWQTYYNYRTSENTHWSNIQKLRTLINEVDRDKKTSQVVFYLRGVGTGNWFDKRITGGAFADGVYDQVLDAYMTVCDNYIPGDELFLFGFSRGAAAARALAGMITTCGILRAHTVKSIAGVWKYYKQSAPMRVQDPFRAQIGQTTHKGVKIKLIGVWDTVFGGTITRKKTYGIGQLEYKIERRFSLADLMFDTTFVSEHVDYAFQALAIDERRSVFEPILWQRDNRRNKKQIVKQVWFPGVHSEVGGGYESTGMSDISLDWMIRNARAAGLKFHEVAVAETVKPNLDKELADSTPGWESTGISERFSELNETTYPGEHIHSSALALYKQAVKRGKKDYTYDPRILRERRGIVHEGLIEDRDLLPRFMNMMGADQSPPRFTIVPS